MTRALFVRFMSRRIDAKDGSLTVMILVMIGNRMQVHAGACMNAFKPKGA
jgi:hypothetical protein